MSSEQSPSDRAALELSDFHHFTGLLILHMNRPGSDSIAPYYPTTSDGRTLNTVDEVSAEWTKLVLGNPTMPKRLIERGELPAKRFWALASKAGGVEFYKALLDTEAGSALLQTVQRAVFGEQPAGPVEQPRGPILDI